MSDGPRMPSMRYVPPALRTRADLQRRVDEGKTDQNMHGYADLARWIDEAKRYGEKLPISKWARRMRKDRRTIKHWVEVYEADR